MQTEPRRAGAALPSSSRSEQPAPVRQPVFAMAALCSGRSALVWLHGELDLQTAPDLRAQLQPLVKSLDERVVLDLSDLTFVDCSGIEEFLRARTLLRATGGDLYLRAAPSTCVRVLEILELTDLLAETVQKAPGASHAA